jgi:parallel beta-helix repeat protein
VVEFYAEGGGAAHGMSDNLDNFVQGFTLTDQEKEDLIAFLYALTDESQLPELPTVALSGLPTVTALDQPQRAIAARINSPVGGGQPTAGAPRELYVQAGESVQDTVDRARPGDTILVPYARYNERVVIDMSDITLRGVPNANGQYPIFDGQNRLPEAVISSGNNFTISHLHVRNYTDNGILVEGVTNVHFHDLISENTGTYGIYPVRSTDVLIERVTASGVNDAAIYAGQCENVIVRDSEVFDSVLGIEIENSLNGDVYNNYAHDNSVGIFYVVLPNLNSKASRGGKVYDNRVVFNNTENFAEANMAAALVPSGVGILLLGSDNIEVTNNTIRNNKTTGVAVFSLTVGYDPDEIDVAPNPDNNWIHNNIYENNGYKPDSFVAGMGIPTGDILWDGSGWDNRFDEPTAQGGFPPILPGSSTATPWVKIYYRLLNTAIRVAG